MRKTDYLIYLGDFGIIRNQLEYEVGLFEQFLKKPFFTLFLDGDFDNINVLNKYPVKIWNGGKVHLIDSSIIHLMRGQIYTIDDKTIFVMGGAETIDKSHRKEGLDYWREEIPSDQEINEAMNNLDQHNWNVDIVLTHTAAPSVIEPYYKHIIEDNRLNRFFTMLEKNLKYKHWFFGHVHKDEKIDEKHTVIYEDFIKILKRENYKR
jgi:DNA repair exonuclease SbcCD nuclease subunit